MSEQDEIDFSKKLETMGKLANLIKLLLILSFAFGGWIATLEFRHRATERYAKANTEGLRKIDLWKERTEANRFDAKQGNELQSAFLTRANLQDLKVVKLEAGQEEIRKSLSRIELKLGTK